MSDIMYSATELAELGLPVLPGTHQNITRRAESECWPFKVVENVRGGTSGSVRLYSVPDYVERAILARQIEQSGGLLPALTDTPTPELSDRQKDAGQARVAILMHVMELRQEMGTNAAVRKTVEDSRNGELPDPLNELVLIASNTGTISRSTLFKWLSQFEFGKPNAMQSIAPKSAGVASRRTWITRSAGWMAPALKLYQLPQKPTLRAVERQLKHHLPEGVEMPSYYQLRRFIKQMGSVSVNVGRMGTREIKNISTHKRRSTEKLLPTDVYMSDGHQFDAEIAHPIHGRPFRPEITSIIDAATRKVVGWSIDLAESGIAVLDALRHSVQTNGIPAIFYVDRGSGYRNAMISASGLGLLARLGTTLQHSLPYNSQARGIIERLHQTIWVNAAKELPTYMGADMDAQAKNFVHKLTRGDVKNLGNSRLLMRWTDFMAFAAERVERYNNDPHRSLPQITCPETGKRRHLTPNEMWAKGVEEGALIVEVSKAEADHLFRPQCERRTRRGEIQFLTNTYFSQQLEEFHGEGVRIGYDIHDASSIFVYDANGVFICEAGFEANKTDMFPLSLVEQAAQKRLQGREKRLMGHLEEVREEFHGGRVVLENNPSQKMAALMPERGKVAVDAELVELIEPELLAESKTARPVFGLPSERYEYLKSQDRNSWSEKDQEWLRGYVADPDGYALFTQRFELLGIEWSDEDDAAIASSPKRAWAGM